MIAAWYAIAGFMLIVYVVLDGQLSVKNKTEEVTLGPMDSLYLGPNEGREILNKTNKPVTMLVVINY